MKDLQGKTNDELREHFGVTGEQLDAWADEYESDDWSHMAFGEIIQGRPRLANEPLDTIAIKIPRSRSNAIKRIQEETGITRSAFIRQAIEHELVSMS